LLSTGARTPERAWSVKKTVRRSVFSVEVAQTGTVSKAHGRQAGKTRNVALSALPSFYMLNEVIDKIHHLWYTFVLKMKQFLRCSIILLSQEIKQRGMFKMSLRLSFTNADEMLEGINEVSEDLFFEVSDCADITVKAEKNTSGELKVSLRDKNCVISYTDRVCFFRGLMILCQAVSEGKKEIDICEKPFFENKGMMLDLSRNNSLNEKSLKYFIRQHAVMGLNTVMLYMEDMYEVPVEPYFGYMRGRYSADMLKRLDDYAYELGVELVPHIELLGHMGKFLRHFNCSYLRGGSVNEFLVGDDKTYAFIEEMVKSISTCFRTDKVHIGFDETMTINKGPYLARHGQVPLEEVFFEHLTKVCEIVKKYGLRPNIHMDMFFTFRWKGAPPKNAYHITDDVEFDDAIKTKIPENIDLTMWNYTEEDEDRMCRIFKKSKELGRNVYYFGSAKMYQSLCCKYEPTVKIAVVGLNACRKENIKNAILCTWQDSAECPHFLALPVALIYAEMDYTGKYSEGEMQRRVKFLYGIDYEDFLKMGDADQIHENEHPELATKFMLYNDPLMGLLDKNIENLDLRKFYGKMVKDYENRGKSYGGMKLSFDQFKAFLDVLELKADYGVRLKKAYDKKDMDTLRKMCDEAIVIKSRYEKLMEIDRQLFTEYFQGFGFESIETRRATMAARFETTRYKLEKFILGEIDKIEELEEERLLYNRNPFENETENVFFGDGFNTILSLCM